MKLIVIIFSILLFTNCSSNKSIYSSTNDFCFEIENSRNYIYNSCREKYYRQISSDSSIVLNISLTEEEKKEILKEMKKN